MRHNKILQHLMITLLGLIFLWTVVPDSCRASEEEEVNRLLDEYAQFYGEAFNTTIEGLDNSGLDQLIPEFDAAAMLRQLSKGEMDFTVPGILNLLVKLLLGEFYSSMKIMALVLALAVLCAYLTGLQDGFGKEGVTQAAFYVCYIVIAGVTTTAFYQAASCVGQAVSNISVFMKMIVPVVITTLVTSGAMISASVFEPVLISVVEIAVTVIESLFIPIVLISTALNIVNGLSDKFKTDRMVKFMNQGVKWGLSIMLTIFISVAGVQSIASAGADGLTVKLTKFAASNLIPVVGGILSESVETIMNCSVVIKNSVGILGIICLVGIALTPLLKIAAILLVFRLTAAVAEPISEPKVVACISQLANSVSVLFSMLAAVTVMFVIVLTIVINAGNTAIMLGR